MSRILFRKCAPALIILLLAGGLRLWGVGSPSTYIADEAAQVPAAKAYLESGNSDPTFWHHPPAGQIMTGLTIRLLGDGPYGWRLRNVLTGTVLVLMVYLVCCELFADRSIAALAALILAVDPLQITVSRMTTDEIPAALFFFIAWYATARYVKRKDNSPLLAGLAVGVSLATKAYYGFGLIALFIYAWQRDKSGNGATLPERIHLILIYFLVPINIYILCYLPWFGRGYSIADFCLFIVDAYRDLALMTHDWFRYDSILRFGGTPAQWFLRPNIMGLQISPDASWRRYLIYINDPPIWLLTWPAFLCYLWKEHKGVAMSLSPPMLFLLSYLPLLAVSRPIYLYSATAVFPFCAVIIGWWLNHIARHAGGSGRIIKGVLCVLILGLGLYTYPLATRKDVPFFAYKLLLNRAAIIKAY